MEIASSRQSVVNTMVVVDTNYIVSTYSAPSMDLENPTSIDNNAVYLVVANGKHLSGSHSSNMVIHAQPGDYINWFGVSESNNFNNEIIVYDATLEDRMGILSTPNFIQIEHSTMLPSIGYPKIEAVERDATTWYVTAVLLQRGEGVYNMQFALYVPGAKGCMELYGYFQWTTVLYVL